VPTCKGSKERKGKGRENKGEQGKKAGKGEGRRGLPPFNPTLTIEVKSIMEGAAKQLTVGSD